MATPQNKIFEALEDIEDRQLSNWLRSEITMLKTQLSDTEEKYQKMRKKFDDLMMKMYGGGRK